MLAAEVTLAIAGIQSRKRAHRLIKRVAKDIDRNLVDMSTDEIVDLCTQHTISNCILFQYLTFPDQIPGGYLWQYWLTIAGPRWVMKMIEERLQVTCFLPSKILYNIFENKNFARLGSILVRNWLRSFCKTQK